ncbi:hypothetical protein MRX96_024077 [Rhipicephalus microplus]
MGDHVLVKWASEKKWDMYPLRNIMSQTVLCQLIDDPKYVPKLTNQAVQVLRKDDEYAPAYILEIDLKETASSLRKTTSQLTDSRSSVASPAQAIMSAVQVSWLHFH